MTRIEQKGSKTLALYVLLGGNTYHHREQIKKYGGEFDGERSVWVLLVPKKNASGRAAFEKWIDELSSDGVRVEWV